MILLAAFIQSIAVAAPLYALSTAFAHKFDLPAWKAAAAAIVGLGVLGFAQFWIVFFDTDLAILLRGTLLGASLWFLAQAGRRRNKTDFELLFPCLAVVVFSTLLIGWAYLGNPELTERLGALRLAAERWTFPLPGDNEIPYVFAQQLRFGQIATPMYGDWLSSDRPPLQTGLYLLLNAGGDGPFGYQASATAMQLLCLPAVYLLARSLGASLLWSCLTMPALFFTPLVFVNGLFVWPKLLAGAALCATASIHFGEAGKSRGVLDGVIAGGGAALGMLSHGATAFAILGFGLAALFTLRFFSWRYCAAGIAIAATLYLPWTLYQRFYDPPGDRLMKWHLAGVVPIDARSLPETLRDEYGKLSVDGWIDRRVSNLRTIVGDPLKTVADVATGTIPVAEVRARAFFSLPLGLGLFGIALWCLPGFLFPSATRSLALATSLGLLVWAGLMFDGGATIVHQGSYFPQLAIVAMSVYLLSRRAVTSYAGLALLAAHIMIVGLIHAIP